MSEARLLIATTNRGKVREISGLLAGAGVDVIGLDDIPQGAMEAPAEDGNTFCANALIKASVWMQRSGIITLADDSGLVVDCLDGAPGIYSSRFAGPDATDQENNACLLEKLDGVPEPDRTAAFHCCIALCRSGHPELLLSGKVEGRILQAPRGSGGFGYDPLFYFPPLGKSFAQLDPSEKNRVSHRADALRKLLLWLDDHPLAG